MNNIEFKKQLGQIAKKAGFTANFGGWFRESQECIVALDLQKSNYGNYYQLMVKIYVQGIFNSAYSLSKYLIKNDVGHIFLGEPNEYSKFFDLEALMDDKVRVEGLEKLFTEFIAPFSEKALSRTGIKELANQGIVYLLPAVKKQLGF